MIPDVWIFALLALAAFRVTRLAGWDTFPPAERARARLLKTWIEPRCSSCNVGRTDYEGRPHGWVGLERCPSCNSADPPIFVEGYSRPLLADLFNCPFCLGFWVCLAAYLSWLAAPTVTLVVAIPFALSTVVGLAAKNLDA